MIEERHVPLGPLTTLRLGGPASRVVQVQDEAAIGAVLAAAEASSEPVFVLGGGSNVVVADAGFSGLVLRVASRGIVTRRRGTGVGEDCVLVDVAAGESWDGFVERCVSDGLRGVECLSGIPGLVGATPIQNVGAYGQEVRETIARVRVFDRKARAYADLDPSACRFGYRTSLFRSNPRYVVVSVAFELAVSPLSVPLRYAELTRALGIREGARAPLAEVRATVIALRRAKGMVLDPGDPDSMSAGSFFVNPTLSAAALSALEARVAEVGVLQKGEAMPRFAAEDGMWKVSAGWLVERAGFVKGYGTGRVGVSRKHALALVHRGGGTADELIALAREIREGVRAKFGVELAPEPVFVGCTF